MNEIKKTNADSINDNDTQMILTRKVLLSEPFILFSNFCFLSKY